MSDGPDNAVADTPTETVDESAPLRMEGFEDTMIGNGIPPEESGQPEQAEAVDTKEVEEIPDPAPVKDDAPAADTKTEEDTVESEAEPTVNFDGFTKDQQATWERLHNDGHATSREIEDARMASLRQSDYTKKTMALADQRKALEAKFDQNEEDLELLEKIRGNPRLHDKWMKMSSVDADAEGDTFGDDDDLLDTKTARQLVVDAIKEDREAVKAEASKTDAAYDTKFGAIQVAMQESMETHSIDAETMTKYLAKEEALLAEGVDPVESIDPLEWQRRVVARHEKTVLETRIAELEQQASQKVSKADRTAKQSLAPDRKVAQGGHMTVGQQTSADLGLSQNWGNVSGFGNPVER